MISFAVAVLETPAVPNALVGTPPCFRAGAVGRISRQQTQYHFSIEFNLSRINALHSDISSYWNEHNENIPATKYMDLSLIFLWWLRKNKELSINEKVEKLFEIITDPKNTIDTKYETIKDREIDINTKNLIPKDIKKL